MKSGGALAAKIIDIDRQHWRGGDVEVLGFGNPRGDGSLGVRSDLTPVTSSPPMFEGSEVGFLGTVTSRKLPKVKEKPTVASICAVTLAKKTTPVLAAIKLDVRALSPLPGAPTVGLLFRPVHQGCTRW